MSKPIVKSKCPKCGPVLIHNKDNVVVFYPTTIKTFPYLEITCEECNGLYKISVDWENARKVESHGCKVVPFSMDIDKKFGEEDISAFMANFDERLEEFLDEYATKES